MTIGIYAIYFEKLDKIYIGQSQNIEQRFVSHKSLFNRGHYNYKMAEAYSIDSNPIYSILEICQIKDLNKLEIYYINEFDSLVRGLNIQHGGDSGIPGYSSGKCKNTKDELESAFNLLADPSLTKIDVINMTNVSGHVLDKILSKNRHIWLHEQYPEISQKILDNKSIRATNAQVRRFGTDVYFVSPEGVEYHCTNMSKFAKEHDLNIGHLGSLKRNQILQHKGWKLKEGRQQNE